MNEERAHEIAVRIRDEFEDLLDEKNTSIPSADREGVPGEARLYGEENTRLVDLIVELLVKHADGIILQGDTDDAGHPVRELAILICEEFEDLLDDKGVMIPSSDREGCEEEACLYGAGYYALEDSIVGILVEELGASPKRKPATGVGDDARAAVEAMQRQMKEAPEGHAQKESQNGCTRLAPGKSEPRSRVAGRAG